MGQKKYIFKGNDNITKSSLKENVLKSLKKADGSPIDELDVISTAHLKKLFPEFSEVINDQNKVRFLLQRLDDENIFNMIFEVVE